MLLKTLVEDTAQVTPCIQIRTTGRRGFNFGLSKKLFFATKLNPRRIFCLPAPDFQSTSREFLMSRINSFTFSTSRTQIIEWNMKNNVFTSEWFDPKTAVIRSPARSLKVVQSSASHEGTVLPTSRKIPTSKSVSGWKREKSHPEVRSGTHLLAPASLLVFLNQPYWWPTTAPTSQEHEAAE